MLLTINLKLSKVPPTLNVALNYTVLRQSNNVKHLSVIIDFKLYFDTHFKTLAH